MKCKYKIFIILLFLLAWGALIFYASHKTSSESNMTSKNIIKTSLKIAIGVTNKFHITKIKPTESNINQIVEELNYPVRKLAHAMEYFILAIISYFLLKKLGLNKVLCLIISLIFCFCFSLSDEYHQTFIAQRTGQFTDCLIDTLGATIGTCLTFLISKNNNTYTNSK